MGEVKGRKAREAIAVSTVREDGGWIRVETVGGEK